MSLSFLWRLRRRGSRTVTTPRGRGEGTRVERLGTKEVSSRDYSTVGGGGLCSGGLRGRYGG